MTSETGRWSGDRRETTKLLDEITIMQLDVLVIAPHPDDAELGMGGAILKFKEEGLAVGVLDLTDGEPTPHGSPAIRAEEMTAATAVLGLDWRENLGLRNRFLEPTLDARKQLAEVFRRVRPRWLFAPYWTDAHPDHIAATQLVDAARFWAKLSKSDMSGDPFHPQRIYNYYCVHLKTARNPRLSSISVTSGSRNSRRSSAIRASL